MDEPTREGQRLIDDWQSAVQHLDRTKQEVNSAYCVLDNATNALGRWMVPDDINIGETLCVWHGASLIAVTKTEASGLGTFKIKVRKSDRKAPLMETTETTP